MKKVLCSISILFNIFCFSLESPRSNYNSYFFNLSNILGEDASILCYSPYSIRNCMLMSMLGANSETYQEFVHALYPLAFEKETLYPKYNNNDDSFKLESACKLFVNKDETLLELFGHHSRVFFRANPEFLDFSEPDESSEKINSWVSKKTNKHIDNIVIPSDIGPDLRLLLLNTLYFKGSWVFPFKEKSTKEKTFYSSDKPLEMPFLIQEQTHNFFEDDECRIACLQIKNGENQPKMGFVIFLPKDNFSTPLKSSLKYFSNLKNLSFQPLEIHLEIPKLSFRSSLDMKAPLQKLGINQAFQSYADFSKINGKKNLYISKVLHKCVIDLNEAGVSAAAVTAASINLTCFKDKPPVRNFVANKPFAFMIIDLTNDNCLFAGQFNP